MQTDALPAEAQVERALKAENPKGRLLELCTRMRLDHPSLETSIDGAHHVAELTLRLEGKALRSGAQRAATRKAAEQLAAASLLRMVADSTAIGDARPVGEGAAAALVGSNPKGRLLERCAGEAGLVARFEQRADASGYAARAVVRAESGAVLTTAWYVAPQAKAAEQAAAEEALANLGRLSASTDTADRAEVPREPAPPTREPRMLLNELRQFGIIADFGYRVLAQKGPVHQPVFVVVAWARQPDGVVIEGSPAESGTKKGGERDAAELLVHSLAEAGLVARRESSGLTRP